MYIYNIFKKKKYDLSNEWNNKQVPSLKWELWGQTSHKSLGTLQAILKCLWEP